MPAKKIASLWKLKNPKENSPVATGILEIIIGSPVHVALFRNTKKIKPNQPDFNLVISERLIESKEEKELIEVKQEL